MLPRYTTPMDRAVLAGLEASSIGIAETGNGQRLAFVAATDEIQSIELAHGFRAERLWLQVAFAVTMLGLGLYGLGPFVAEALSDEPTMTYIHFGYVGGGIFFAVGGLIALVGALRRGPHLKIHTARGVRRLVVRDVCTREQMDEFLTNARRVLGLG